MLSFRLIQSPIICSSLLPPLFVMSCRSKGHAKWQNIMHIKAANDAKRSKVNALYAMKIGIAIKENSNEANPKYNRSLAKVIEQALADNVTRTVVDSALKRAKDPKSENLKEFATGIRGPAGAFMVVESVAPTQNHVSTNINSIVKKYAFIQDKGTDGLFKRRGKIIFKPPPGMDLDAAEELAIECGAEEVEEEKDGEDNVYYTFYTDVNSYYSAKTSIQAASEAGEILSSGVVFEPLTRVSFPKAFLKKMEEFEAKLMDCPSVSAVHHNFE